MGRDPREEWGRQLISSMTIGAPCALRKLQKGEGTTGEWSRAPRGGRRRRRFGNGKGQRRGWGRDLEHGPRPGPSAVLRRAAPQAALEVGRVPHGRVRADERVPAGAAALHEPRVVWGRLAPKLQGLAADAAAPRRRDFAWGLCVDPCGRRGRANSSSVCFFSRCKRILPRSRPGHLGKSALCLPCRKRRAARRLGRKATTLRLRSVSWFPVPRPRDLGVCTP